MRLNGVPPSLLQQRHRHPFRHGVEHRDGNLRAFAGAAARDQRFQDRLDRRSSPAAISTIETPTRAGASGPPVTEATPDFGLDQQVVGLALRVRAALAVAGDRAADQPRIILAQPLERQSRAWPSAPGLRFCTNTSALREHGLEQRLVVGLA